MSESQRERQPLLSTRPNDAIPVWPIIHMIREASSTCTDVMHYIDTPLTFEALTAPDLTYTLVRPLEEKYNAMQRAGNKSVVFCFLLNRVYFTRDQSLTTGPLSCTRADLCELLAIRLLRDNGNSMLDLVITLTTSWTVWSGADPHVIQMAREERDDELEERVGNALEMAIIGKARRFIKSSPCQKVIDGIWLGKCVYQAESSYSILSDRYKRNPVHFYDPHKAPLLDHYRLKVPAIRSVLEYVNFLILFVLFVFAIETNDPQRINKAELIFMVYGLGFAIEKIAAMQERGIRVYFKGTWNGFDLAFVTTYSIYAFFRIYGIVYYKPWARDLGTDFLAVIACLLFPRLAFVTLQNNLMVLSLRAMMMQFVALMLIAAFCFCGFLYALWTLSRKGAGYSASTIAWWMLDLWFGLDASGFDRAAEFDVVFGPILMIMYACLSNTLLLTVLVSILSNTFARINEDAAAEAMFRRAVCMLEGLMITNFPILLVIACFKGQRKKTNSHGFYDTVSAAAEKLFDGLPRSLRRMSLFEGLARSGAAIDVIFEVVEPSEEAVDADNDLDTNQAQVVPRRQISRKSDHRPSKGSSRSGPAPKEHTERSIARPSTNEPSPPPRASGHTRQVSVPISLRRRLNSHSNKTDMLQSPLAQIFQPVVVNDEIHDRGSDKGSLLAPSSNSHMVSYGPASRRLSSLHATPASMPKRTSDSSAKTPAITRRPPFPAIDTRPEVLDSGPISASPDQEPEPQSTAEEVEENIQESGGMTELFHKINRMEERQKRIEDLLVQLSTGKRS
ncbi:hypothetical protein ID866_4489 [Astraeus odoratus]|nr:hypothetical protein ID866_4489 [Astraeus odoratus]